MNTTIFIA